MKNQPRLTLAAVLRRRRTTLKKLVDELGVSTYTALVNWCDRMGITPPERAEFDEVFPPALKVNSPQEGVVVLDPPPVVDEHTGRNIDPEVPVLEPGVEVVTEPTDPPQKKRRTKKESQPDEG